MTPEQRQDAEMILHASRTLLTLLKRAANNALSMVASADQQEAACRDTLRKFQEVVEKDREARRVRLLAEIDQISAEIRDERR